MNVWDAIRTKRAVRHFTPDPLSDAHIQRILEAGRRSQSSKNSQPWHFIAVQERDTLQKIGALDPNLAHVGRAVFCVVLCVPIENERTLWHFFDSGQSAAFMQLAAQEISVGSCLGTIYHVDEARALLGLPPKWQARLLISFGYPDPTHQRTGQGKAGRRGFEDVVHWNQW